MKSCGVGCASKEPQGRRARPPTTRLCTSPGLAHYLSRPTEASTWNFSFSVCPFPSDTKIVPSLNDYQWL